MQKVESGKFISVNYTGTLADGKVFDSSEGRQPMEFKMGGGQLIKGFEDAVMGMSINEEKTFTLDPDQAYGQRDEDQIHEFPKEQAPADMDCKVGDTVALGTPEGQQIPARIIAMDDEKLTFDLNHPLAGQSLTFKIEVVGISETATQQPQGCGGSCGPDCSC